MKNLRNIFKTGHLLQLIVLLGTFSAVNLFSMRMTTMGKASAKRWLGQPSRESMNKKRELLIFLDDSEKNQMGMVGGNLATAIYQEAGLIIVSASLFNEVNNPNTQWVGTKDDTVIHLEKINANDLFLIQSIKIFQEDRWIVKKINDLLYLLIPISYLESLGIDKNKVKESGKAVNVATAIELQLGCKVNHMETIDASWSIYANLKSRFLNYFFESRKQEVLADYIINSLETIFCKKLDYQGTNMDIPEWFMFLMGHGFINHSIADLSLDGFKQLLKFLESKINTQLLVVLSCFAGGMNADKIYGEIKLETQQYYSYPIIIQSLNDIISTSNKPVFDWNAYSHDKKIKLFTHIDFVNFFKKAKTLEGNYSEIIKPISFDYYIESTPQIKLPGIEWFSVMEANKKIVSIGSVLTQIRDPQKPLDLISFFKKDPELILLYTDNIPFELVINSTKLKTIVSMVSPKLTEKGLLSVVTRIKKISSTQSFSDVLYWFRLVINSYGLKWFTVDEIGDKKDIVILRTDDGCMRVYYRDKDNVAFTKKLEEKDLKTELKEIEFDKIDKDSEFETYYQDFMRVRDEYPKLSEETKSIRQEIIPEQIKKIENVLIKQREKQILK